VVRVAWDVPLLERRLAAAPQDQMSKYRAVFAQGRGVAWDTGVTFNAANGIDMTTAAEWIEQHLK
jgi:hypothetical protein